MANSPVRRDGFFTPLAIVFFLLSALAYRDYSGIGFLLEIALLALVCTAIAHAYEKLQ